MKEGWLPCSHVKTTVSVRDAVVRNRNRLEMKLATRELTCGYQHKSRKGKEIVVSEESREAWSIGAKVS